MKLLKIGSGCGTVDTKDTSDTVLRALFKSRHGQFIRTYLAIFI